MGTVTKLVRRCELAKKLAANPSPGRGKGRQALWRVLSDRGPTPAAIAATPPSEESFLGVSLAAWRRHGRRKQCSPLDKGGLQGGF